MKKAFKLPLIALAGTCLATSVSLVSCSKKYDLNIVEDENIHVLTTKFSLNTDLVIRYTIDPGHLIDEQASTITINETVYHVSELTHDDNSVTLEASKVNYEVITVEFKTYLDPDYEWDIQIVEDEFIEVFPAKFKLNQPLTIYYKEIDRERPYEMDPQKSTVTIGTIVHYVKDLGYSSYGQVKIDAGLVNSENIIVSIVSRLDPTEEFNITDETDDDHIEVKTKTFNCSTDQEIYFETDDEYMFDPANSTITIGSKMYLGTQFEVSKDHITIPKNYIDRDSMIVAFASKIDPDWHYSLNITTDSYIEVKTKTFQLNRDLTIKYNMLWTTYILDEENSTITIGDKQYLVIDFAHDKDNETIFIPAELVNSKSISLDFHSKYKVN